MRIKVPVWLPGLLGIVVMSALVFLSSGHFNYWEGWVYFGVNLAIFTATARALRNEPGLVAERLNPGKGMKWWDKGYFLLSTPLYFAAVILAGIDAGRRHWSQGPPASLYLLAVVVYIGGQGLFLWAKKVNSFFSSVARIQIERGQAVVREGPYRFCRHPGRGWPPSCSSSAPVSRTVCSRRSCSGTRNTRKRCGSVSFRASGEPPLEGPFDLFLRALIYSSL